jgi:uncharacterized protein (DUF885 family)
MSSLRTAAHLGLAVLLAGACRSNAATATPSAHTSVSSADGAFPALTESYFRARYAFSPSEAVAQGFHEYDARLEDRSSATIRARIDTLTAQRARLAAVPVSQLSVDDSVDAAFLASQIDAELLDLDTIRWWEKNPTDYVAIAGGGVDVLMKRNFAPASERLRSVTARLRGVPALVAAMRENVKTPPKEFTDIAIRVARGSVGFFRDDVARWAKEAAGSDTAALRQFTAVNDSATAALAAAATWLSHELKPKSTGRYAIGRENFAAMLRTNEMVDIPLDTLLRIGEANLAKDRAAFLATARRIDPKKSPAEVMHSLENDHPGADSLLAAARSTIEGARQFLIDRKIVTVPSEVRPRIEETPPYARAGSFASMDTPGAFETRATEAFYYVTPPEKDWDARHVEEHLRLYNKPVMDIITVHEAFPGHYLQFLYARQFPTKVRKLLYVSSNAEGWAHYSEQMMVEEGFGGGDPKVRLAQLSEALLRDCRFITGIRIHTQPGWTVDRAARELFVDQCFQQPANGYEEARRGAYNPTYLYYTLGKLIIYKLRDDYKAAKGDGYTLQGFHDAFVKQGSLPLPIIRRLLLPNDRRPVL